MGASSQPRIAFLVDNLASEYPAELTAGVLRAARQKQARVLVVPGGELGSPSRPLARNFIYDWLAGARIDGLVVAAGSLSNHAGVARLREMLAPFLERVPVVAIGLDLKDVPSVYVDNESGMFEVVSHLIEAHARHRIAFVGGPESSLEASAREQGYRRALAQHGVRVDERLMLKGTTLGREDGLAAAAELFEVRRFTHDTLHAIVGMNDEVALGVLEDLGRRGVAVPKSIALAGFDNSGEARAANPPLTSVNQHVEQQGYAAAHALLEALEKSTAAVGGQLMSSAVFRASCGCEQPLANDSAVLAAQSPPLRLARSAALALIERRSAITSELVRAANGRLAGLASWDSHLADALVSDFGSKREGTFLRELERMVRQHAARGHSTAGFHDVLTALRLQLIACSGVEADMRPRVEDLMQEARLNIARIGAEVERARLQTLGQHLRLLWECCVRRLGSSETEPLGPVLDRHLPGLGVGSFCITRWRPEAAASRELEVVWRRSARGASRQSHALARADLGIDAALEAEAVLVLLPLDFDARPVGLAALTWGAHDLTHYGQLRDMLGAAVHGQARASKS